MDLSKYYEDFGYILVEDLIPGEKIDNILRSLENFKRLRLPHYSQSIHCCMQPTMDDHGYMQESINNFTSLFFNGGLKSAGNDILLGNEISNTLKRIKPNVAKFSLRQNMLFDPGLPPETWSRLNVSLGLFEGGQDATETTYPGTDHKQAA